MNQTTRLEEFNNLLKELAQAVYTKVNADLPNNQWLTACLDVRYNKEGSSWLSKLRAITSNEEVSLSESTDIDLLLITLNEKRDSVFDDVWYGLQLKVDESGNCQTKLNYDPDCFEDDSFYES